MATLTIRCIRSFEYRNIKNMILKDIDLENTTTEQLMQKVNEEIQKNAAWAPHRTKKYDTMKICHKAHGFKSQNLVINLENDDTLILKKDQTLAQNGVETETEISYFVMDEYQKYKENPQVLW
eukprot:GEZU01003518.1.p1 GENE.GEZU01003518.1~~GEZU01003518.1.p1  ORF type:complete len:123 (-),score=44.32 GEZU01003518.1:90-458(-)